jgi:hypothetical protein
MRRTAFVVLAAAAVAGCIDLTSPGPPPPPTVTEGGAMVFRAEGDEIVPVPLPDAFGDGLAVASVATGFRGAEPNIGVTRAGSVFVSAFESILRSRDQGRTWEEVHHMALGQTFDPMLWVDVPTSRVFSTHIYPDKTCSTLIWSADPEADEPTWTELPLRCPSPLVDHQKFATGPPAGALAPVGGLQAYPRLVTLCYNKLEPPEAAGTHCATSLDGGVTYATDVLVDASQASRVPPSTPAKCGGLNGHQAHMADGTILLPYGYDCRRGRVAVSTDGGLTWTRRDLGVDQLELDPDIAVTADGTAYYVYRGHDQAVHMLRSRDRFANVDGPFRVSPPEVRSTVFVATAAGSGGRVAFAYLGTPDTDAGPDDAGPDTEWNLYVGMTLDAASAAPTIVTVQVNPDGDPVQRGSICHSKACVPAKWPNNRNLLDFIDMAAGPDGRFWVSYADGCTDEDCLRAGSRDIETSRDDVASVAWLLEGPSLLAGRPRLTGP